MVTGGSWELSGVSQQASIPWGVVQLPAGPNGVKSVFNGLTDAIYVKTPHQQEAWQLEKWLASSQSEHIMGSGGYVWPAIQSEDQSFTQYWQKKGIDVSPFLTARRVFDHPTAGRLEFAHHRLAVLDQPGMQLVVYTAAPGSNAVGRLETLWKRL